MALLIVVVQFSPPVESSLAILSRLEDVDVDDSRISAPRAHASHVTVGSLCHGSPLLVIANVRYVIGWQNGRVGFLREQHPRRTVMTDRKAVRHVEDEYAGETAVRVSIADGYLLNTNKQPRTRRGPRSSELSVLDSQGQKSPVIV